MTFPYLSFSRYLRFSTFNALSVSSIQITPYKILRVHPNNIVYHTITMNTSQANALYNHDYQ
jgi:hypothetical protein